MNNTALNKRLQALEARLIPVVLEPMMNEIFEVDTISELLELLEYCDARNKSKGGVYYAARWVGAADPIADELLAGKFDTGKGGRMDLIHPVDNDRIYT